MSRYLCVSATFLDPWFHGRGDDRPEWPPSPMRLFQALVRAAATDEDARPSLRWLEQREEAPLIVAPQAELATGYTVYVPNNDGDRVRDRQKRLTGKERRPYYIRDGDTLHYLWRLEDTEVPAAKTHVRALRGLARRLVSLGLGLDQAVANARLLDESEATQLRGQQWRAWPLERQGLQGWRVPIPGSLEDLDGVHNSFLARVAGLEFRPPAHLRKFRTVSYLDAATRPARPCAVFELPDGVAFRQVDAAKVAAMLRSATIAQARADDHAFPGGDETYVAGHTDSRHGTPPRFSYLPLPTVGHPHADGMIRRLVVAEPAGTDGVHAAWARIRLRNAALRDEDGNERGLLLEPWRNTSKTLLRSYVDAADAWLSVTPVVLPGFDDGSLRKAERLLIKALQHAEIPAESVEDAILRKAPFFPGSQHPRQYFLPDYLRGRAVWHVRLVLRQPVPGPLALGAGRHAGLGLFAAG